MISLALAMCALLFVCSVAIFALTDRRVSPWVGCKRHTCLLHHTFLQKNRENKKTSFDSKPNMLSKVVFFVFLFCSSSLVFLWFVYCFIWLPFVPLCLRTLSVLGSQTLIKVSHSRACALCETKLGIGCAVMFMHLKISCCSAFLLYCLSLATSVQILESWNLGFVHTRSCLGLTYSNKVYKYKYLENTFGHLGGNGGVFLWEHVTLLCDRML